MNDTELCNLALAEIGDSYNITSIDEISPQAGICKRFYDSTRDALLREHPWSFARARADLARLSTAPLFGWDYQFQLPANFLRLIEFNGLDAWQPEGAYELEGGVILTDAAAAQIIYVKRVTEANLYDALFVEAFTLKLAARICTKLTKDDGLQEGLMRRYRMALGQAKKLDANETRPRRILPFEDSDLVRSRLG